MIYSGASSIPIRIRGLAVETCTCTCTAEGRSIGAYEIAAISSWGLVRSRTFKQLIFTPSPKGGCEIEFISSEIYVDKNWEPPHIYLISRISSTLPRGIVDYLHHCGGLLYHGIGSSSWTSRYILLYRVYEGLCNQTTQAVPRSESYTLH